MSHGQHGANLEQEGYGTVSVTEIAADDLRRLGHNDVTGGEDCRPILPAHRAFQHLLSFRAFPPF